MSVTAARPLGPRTLLGFSRFFADEVAAGKYPYIDFDPVVRWHQRLYRDPRLDIWVISWLPDQGTQLHDHGGSSGSFTVLAGTLTETVVRQGRLRDIERPGATSAAFGPRHVHDVRNVADVPAVSVHAYSPPLTSMTYYDLTDGRLRPLRRVTTHDPEPEFAAALGS